MKTHHLITNHITDTEMIFNSCKLVVLLQPPVPNKEIYSEKNNNFHQSSKHKEGAITTAKSLSVMQYSIPGI